MNKELAKAGWRKTINWTKEVTNNINTIFKTEVKEIIPMENHNDALLKYG